MGILYFIAVYKYSVVAWSNSNNYNTIIYKPNYLAPQSIALSAFRHITAVSSGVVLYSEISFNRALQNRHRGTEYPFDGLPFQSSPGGSSAHRLSRQALYSLDADRVRWIAAMGTSKARVSRLSCCFCGSRERPMSLSKARVIAEIEISGTPPRSLLMRWATKPWKFLVARTSSGQLNSRSGNPLFLS